MTELFDHAATSIEVAAVVILAGGLVLAALRCVVQLLHRRPGLERLRRDIGHSLLLALELLIAADVIETLTVEPTLSSLGALGVLVLIRTFLSFSLSVELHGHWPWQAPTPSSTTAGD